MEEWEKTHVRENLSKLIQQTKCTPTLLAILTENGILAEGDTDKLSVLSKSEMDKAMDLYEIIITRVGAYPILMKALREECQTGAYEVLKLGLDNREGTCIDVLKKRLFSKPLPAINDFLDDDKTRILVISTLDCQVSLKRMRDTGSEYLIVHHSGPTRAKLRKLDEDHALVVRTQDIESELRKHGDTTKKVVFLTSEKVTDFHKCLAWVNGKAVYEEIGWGDLHSDAHKMILTRSLKFQNTLICLSEIIQQLDHNIKGDLLFALIQNSDATTAIVNTNVPTPPKYYVNRQISGTRRISPAVFKNPGKDVFTIKGIELHGLSRFTPDAGRSSDQMEKLTAQFIKLECDEHFGRICELSGNPVHLLSHHEGQFTWVKTCGSVRLLQKYIVREEILMGEDRFVRECMDSDSHVCIADTPGMGKTVLLSRIGDNIMKEHPRSLVRFIVLREFIQDIANGPITTEMVCEMIAKASSEYTEGREFVTKELKSESAKCFLLFDGYDEVVPEQVPVANQVFQCVKRLNNTQMYVTTRPHMRNHLEEALGALGYTMHPFQHQDQMDFLVNFWGAEGVPVNERLVEFAEICLNHLKENMSDLERDIAGIPLQCRLLGQVHLDQAINYTKNYTPGGTLPHTSSSIFEMYQSFMRMGFDKLELHLKHPVIQIHTYLAIELLYPDICKKFVQFFYSLEPPERTKDLMFVPGIQDRIG